MADEPLIVPPYKSADARLWHYRAFVLRVVDGDTLDMVVDKGFGDFSKQRIRLFGVNTPELHPRKGTPEQREAEKIAANKAKDRVTELMLGKECVIRTSKTGNFGRWLAEVYLPDDIVSQLGRIADEVPPRSLNELLLEEKLATRYLDD